MSTFIVVSISKSKVILLKCLKSPACEASDLWRHCLMKQGYLSSLLQLYRSEHSHLSTAQS